MARIALIQNKSRPTFSETKAFLELRIREAAAGGGQIICAQELCLHPYFCRNQDPKYFDLAISAPGKETDCFSQLAKELGVVLILPVFERIASGIAANTALIYDADGSLLGKYRKMHVPQDPGFEEKFYFAPGDLGYKVWTTRFGKIGVLICWDQWFPEAARLTALQGAEILFYPTAIGWLPEEKELLGEAQHNAWRTVQQGHAIANGCYVATANRVGKEGGTEFWGQSFVSDYMGGLAAEAPSDKEAILYVDCDMKALEEHRRMWPFFRDRRVDSYAKIQERWLE